MDGLTAYCSYACIGLLGILFPPTNTGSSTGNEMCHKRAAKRELTH